MSAQFTRVRRLLVVAVVATFLVRPMMAAEPGAIDRPNVVCLITDQQHAGMMSCAGNRYVSTPAMDSLASTGARFERAYATNPVCMPSRVSMMTGYFPSRFGIRTNGNPPTPNLASVLRHSLGWLFRGAGYETAFGGKTHWARGMTPESLGFDCLTRDEREGLAESCAEFIAREHERPFLLVASFINPHDICYMAIDDYTQATGKPAMYPRSVEERKRLAAALEMPQGISREEFFARLCPPLPANYEIPLLEPECIATRYAAENTFRGYVRRHWSDQRWRQHRWAYCRLTEMVDAHIARVLDAIRKAGLEKRTLVVFLSDHGDMDAAHRLEHKSVLYEESARVPMIVSYPGVTQPGLVDRQHLVSAGADLIPTLCDYAGIVPPADLPGKSLRPLAEGRQAGLWRDQVVVESVAGRMLRTDRYKYSVYEGGAHREQLIDLAEDPGEMDNLAEKPEFQDVLRDHRARLRHWVETTGDEIGRAYCVP